MIDDTRGWLSLFLGILVFGIGLIPFLYHIGLIGFQLPFTIGGIIFPILLIIGSLFLFMDSIHQDLMRKWSVIMGFILLILGIIPLLAYFNIIPADYTASILAIALVKDVILMVTGILLMLGSGD